MFGGAGERLRRAWRAKLRANGLSWVFWPSLALASVGAGGPGRWSSTGAYVLVLLAAGPGLALAIVAFEHRPWRERPRSAVSLRVLAHFRGRA